MPEKVKVDHQDAWIMSKVAVLIIMTLERCFATGLIILDKIAWWGHFYILLGLSYVHITLQTALQTHEWINDAINPYIIKHYL